jgi:hypothetical protein
VKKLSSNQKFETVLSDVLILVGVVLVLLAVLKVGPLFYTLGRIAAGIGILQKVRRYNRSTIFAVAVIFVLFVAYWVMTTELMKVLWRSAH